MLGKTPFISCMVTMRRAHLEMGPTPQGRAGSLLLGSRLTVTQEGFKLQPQPGFSVVVPLPSSSSLNLLSPHEVQTC